MAINSKTSRSLQVTIPLQLHESLTAECAKYGVKPSFVISKLLTEHYSFMKSFESVGLPYKVMGVSLPATRGEVE